MFKSDLVSMPTTGSVKIFQEVDVLVYLLFYRPIETFFPIIERVRIWNFKFYLYWF
jgi:hypothetical protein